MKVIKRLWFNFRFPLFYIVKAPILAISLIFILLVTILVCCLKDYENAAPFPSDKTYPEEEKLGQNVPITVKTGERKQSQIKSINSIVGTKHYMVSAYKDHRFKNLVRVFVIARHAEIGDLFCHLYDEEMDTFHVTPAVVKLNPEILGFAHGLADISCISSIRSTSVRIAKSTIVETKTTYYPIQNLIKPQLLYNFTICLSQIFNYHNNALQFVQFMEINKILGVQRVVIYNISCGPDVEKVMRHYVKEGTLEVVDWNINDFMTPSKGWQPEVHPGDILYHGQVVSLNDCLYRYMYHSKYILFHDFDEIVVPYKHNSLNELMGYMERLWNHDTIGLSRFERYLFQQRQKVDGMFRKLFFKKWERVPGINILEHMSGRWERNPKYMVDPRQIISVKVHDIIESVWGNIVTSNFPTDVAIIHHIKESSENTEGASKETVIDTRKWNFNGKLIPNIDKALEESGVLELNPIT